MPSDLNWRTYNSTDFTMLQEQASILAPLNIYWNYDTFEYNSAKFSGIIETLYTLVSPGTETSVFQGNHPLGLALYPYFPGYASVGRILAVPTDEKQFKLGDLVFFPGKHQKYTDLAQFRDSCIFVNENEVEYAPLIRFGQIAYTVLEVLGEGYTLNALRVATVGLGLIGNLTSQLLKTYGATVTGIDHHHYRAEIALDCGIDHAIVLQEASQISSLEYDLVIEASGSCKGLSYALSLVKYGGTLVLLGSPKEPCLIDFYFNIHRKCIRLIGAHEGCVSRAKRKWYSEKFLDLLRNKNINISGIISDSFSFQDLHKAYDKLVNDKGNTLSVNINWEGSSSQ